MRYTLDDIDTFLAVMELGTVTAAAARLNLAKSCLLYTSDAADE